METKKITTQQILEINVNNNIEKKNGLNYLSWAWAWTEALKIDENATWEVVENNGLPLTYLKDDTAFVKTSVTLNGTTKTCVLPVMNNYNKSVTNPDSFIVNKTIMRCLAKNLAMFGLGLYIYAGEDLPEMSEETKLDELLVLEEKLTKCTTKQQARDLYKEYEGKGKEFADKIMARGKELSE